MGRGGQNPDAPKSRERSNGYRLFRRADLEKILQKIAKPVKPRTRPK
jgi:hypothetical protein